MPPLQLKQQQSLNRTAGLPRTQRGDRGLLRVYQPAEDLLGQGIAVLVLCLNEVRERIRHKHGRRVIRTEELPATTGPRGTVIEHGGVAIEELTGNEPRERGERRDRVNTGDVDHVSLGIYDEGRCGDQRRQVGRCQKTHGTVIPKSLTARPTTGLAGNEKATAHWLG